MDTVLCRHSTAEAMRQEGKHTRVDAPSTHNQSPGTKDGGKKRLPKKRYFFWSKLESLLSEHKRDLMAITLAKHLLQGTDIPALNLGRGGGCSGTDCLLSEIISPISAEGRQNGGTKIKTENKN